MKAVTLAAALLAASLCFARYADEPAAAMTLLASAQSEAAQSGRTVFVGFHASWCGWCKRMEKVLSSPEVKPIWEKYFVPVWLVVLESQDKKNLENPGAMELLAANGGERSGIPYFYFTDAKGKTIVTSSRPAEGDDKGGNVGCPYEAEEVGYFMKMLAKAAPKMDEAERGAIKKAFEALKKSDKKDG